MTSQSRATRRALGTWLGKPTSSTGRSPRRSTTAASRVTCQQVSHGTALPLRLAPYDHDGVQPEPLGLGEQALPAGGQLVVGHLTGR